MILEKLNSQFGMKLNEEMDLFAIGEFLEENDVPFHYIAFDEDYMKQVAEIEEEDVEIYKINDGYIGFRIGTIW